MQAVTLASGHTLHTEVREVKTVDTVGFLTFESTTQKRVGRVRKPDGVLEHGLCMPFMELSLDLDTAVVQVTEAINRLMDYYEQSERDYQKFLKRLGK